MLGRRSPDYFAVASPDNPCVEARQRQPMDAFDRGYVTSALADNFGNGFSSFFPLRVRETESLIADAALHPNISTEAESYLDSVGAGLQSLFYHVVAILHSPEFRDENQGALKQDWPRIPLPASKEVLVASAAPRPRSRRAPRSGKRSAKACEGTEVDRTPSPRPKARSILMPATWNSRQAGATPGKAASPCRRRARSRFGR